MKQKPENKLSLVYVPYRDRDLVKTEKNYRTDNNKMVDKR